MRIVDADTVDRLLRYPGLVDVLADGFQSGASAPPRHHHQIARGDLAEQTLLLMPAWATAAPDGGYACVKLVTVTPDNAARNGLPAVAGCVLLFSGDTGAPLALIDGAKLTVWRTAAASALASRHLSRPDAKHLLMIGAGALAPYLIRAHASIRPIEHVTIWNRTRARAEEVGAQLTGAPFAVAVTGDLDTAIPEADIISVATLSETPLIRGDLLRAGQHVDCVGAFKPTMRETDDAAISKATVWVDTMAGGTTEAGDIVMAVQSGALSGSQIVGDLFDLAAGRCRQRSSDEEITLFKSVGAAIEDLFAAVAVYEADLETRS
ncbi:MAG: ornithine cyclodeaminase family protein [Pseudomonadota bacterium]